LNGKCRKIIGPKRPNGLIANGSTWTIFFSRMSPITSLPGDQCVWCRRIAFCDASEFPFFRELEIGDVNWRWQQVFVVHLLELRGKVRGSACNVMVMPTPKVV
jgi:hypothetical protein